MVNDGANLNEETEEAEAMEVEAARGAKPGMSLPMGCVSIKASSSTIRPSRVCEMAP